jgi:hypothetical protein
MFLRIAYVSRAAEGLGDEAIYDIIRTAHNRNCVSGLTGALLVMDGYFIQVLEGDAFRVHDCFKAIAADRRHTDVDLRHSVSSREMLFPRDWMAVRHGSEIPADLKTQFGYQHGLPRERFTGDEVVAFVQACCRPEQALQTA